MLNEVILIGRLTDNPEAKELENGKKVSTVTVAVGRPFKNAEGLYDTDFIRCILWNNMATNTVQYCKKGDAVVITGRIQISSYNTDDGIKKFTTDIIAEKVSFLPNGTREKEPA